MAPVLLFTLSEEGVIGLRDVLVCLNKFNEEVCLEVKKDQFVLTAINPTKSGYAHFSLLTNKFFSKFRFDGTALGRSSFFCTLYARVLVSIFRSRGGGGGGGADIPGGERSTAIDRCDVAIDDGTNLESRFIVKITFRNGCTSTHKLPFASNPPVHAKFNAELAIHHWTIPSRILRGVLDHFGPGAELLDINSEGDMIKFLGYTEKAVDVNTASIRGKPLRTSIAMDLDEFEDVEVEDELHIIVPVRDFRAIIQHAGIAGTELTARYSTPGQPIKIAYHGDAMHCDFLLMTVGERGNPGQKMQRQRGAKRTPAPVLEATSRRGSAAPSERAPSVSRPTPQPPVARADVQRKGYFEMRPSQMPPPPSKPMSESLFVGGDDDDEWAPVRDEEEEEEEEDARLEWDGTDRRETQTNDERQTAEAMGGSTPASTEPGGSLEPTQRLSDVRRLGLFYDGPSY
ncbi:related to rad9 protein [Cephalotrichum gorgonifer]|uniref:DNA repair protein rad9 n=1 Tax=Cephalotrichum gorgonifer TaxID=2041049 RepID=A0AAE8N042_9PEZI|nr:related to rad9 protein [Cephalotrichum gorgonifer]